MLFLIFSFKLLSSGFASRSAHLLLFVLHIAHRDKSKTPHENVVDDTALKTPKSPMWISSCEVNIATDLFSTILLLVLLQLLDLIGSKLVS